MQCILLIIFLKIQSAIEAQEVSSFHRAICSPNLKNIYILPPNHPIWIYPKEITTKTLSFVYQDIYSNIVNIRNNQKSIRKHINANIEIVLFHVMVCKYSYNLFDDLTYKRWNLIFLPLES